MKTNKDILEKANTAIREGDNEGFLSYCTEDTKWIFVGDQILEGKEAVRRYMAETYKEPPIFNMELMIERGEYVVSMGEISLKDAKGEMSNYSACDVWKFRDGKMCELKAFVILDN
ncbi:nuclear transport factor 2 family protein [Flavobacterium psychroterrae]|uniref:Nuclear transport factor 2 family protein n=1 Tax=Flavobacterium psychroterrae TaxID=2133767 RepID=A0ABS5PGT0_9FLAO|nr:nuclear transport factor 2 family protein [Flavobacterium psychroterrae]MBS7233150.1 nuclear transport factor 2 family protein [Flavobacterium psychroterrae]